VLSLCGGVALASMIVLDGDGLPPLPACAMLAALLVGCSLAAALVSIAAAHVAIALARRVVLAVTRAIAQGRDAGTLRFTRLAFVIAPLGGASLLAAGRGLRAPPSFVR
jgi:AcrR family transcriptional regulator